MSNLSRSPTKSSLKNSGEPKGAVKAKKNIKLKIRCIDSKYCRQVLTKIAGQRKTVKTRNGSSLRSISRGRTTNRIKNDTSKAPLKL